MQPTSVTDMVDIIDVYWVGLEDNKTMQNEILMDEGYGTYIELFISCCRPMFIPR